MTNGTILTDNGVAYSTAAVENGTYTQWGYEHLFYRLSFSGTAKTVVYQITANVISTTASVSGVPLSSMLVTRDGDGKPIEH